MLGYPIVGVEMGPENFDAAYGATERWYSARKGQTKMYSLTLVDGQQAYTMPTDCDEVVDAFFPPGKWDTYQASVLDYGVELSGNPVDIMRDRSGMGPYSRIVQILENNEIARDIFANTYEWFYDTTERVLTIGGNPAGGSLALIKYKSMTVDITKFTSLEIDIFMRFLLAQIKVIYGRILRKHSEIPGASGPKTTDGAELVSEGTAEMERLDERIGMINGPSGFFAG
jgi:hypothetical protein